MIAIAGIGTTIAQQLGKLLPDGEETIRLGDNQYKPCERYLLAAGIIHNKPLTEQTKEEMNESLWVNAMGPIGSCEEILASNPKARICIIGSMSGINGSFDQTYAAAKAGVHNYVRNKVLKPHQQLVCIAPNIIMDSGMTERRNEEGSIALRTKLLKHPKGRYLRAKEVAQLVYFLLYVDEGYITNTVIEMHGGMK